MCVCVCVLSRSVVFNSATPWTAARQAPLSMGVLQTRVLEWVACPPPGNLPNPGIKPRSPALQADSLPSEAPGKLVNYISVNNRNSYRFSFLGLQNHCRW